MLSAKLLTAVGSVASGYGDILFRAQKNAAVSGTTLTCDLPVGTVEGDVLVAHWASRAALADAAMTLPGGWTQVAYNPVASGPTVKLAYKVAGAGEPANYDFVVSSSVAQSVVILAYEGVNNTTPGDAVATLNSGSGGTTLTATGLETVTPGAVLMAFFANAVVTGTTISDPTDMDQRVALSSQCRNTVSDVLIPVAGATGNKVATQATATRWSAILWALRPAGALTVDATLTISDTALMTSKMTPGVSHVNNPSTWREDGWDNAKVALGQAVGIHNLHIFPFGLTDPWRLDSPTTWTPGDEPDPALPNHLDDGTQNCFATALAKMREISASDPIMVTLYGAPWWMKGRMNSSGVTTPCVWSADQFTDQGRVMTQYLTHWQTLVTETCKLAMAAPYNVRWFQVWNEFKGYYQQRDDLGQTWEFDYYAGTAGLNADHGYTWFYKLTVDAVLAAATALSIDPADIKMGGPYSLIRSQGAIDADSVPASGYPTLRDRVWGTMNKQGIKAVEGFHDLVVANSLKYDFLAIDFGPSNNDGVHLTTDQWVLRTKYTDLFDWVATELARVSMSTLPIVGSEVYSAFGGGISETGAAPGFVTAVKADTYRRLLLGGITYPLMWGPEYTADSTSNRDAYLCDDTELASGGTIQPWGVVNQKLKENFGPSTVLLTLTNSGSAVVEAIASATKVLLINKTGSSLQVRVAPGNIVTLAAYGVSVVDR